MSVEAKSNELGTRVCQWIHGLSWSDIPEPVQTKARLTLLDTLGCMAAGAKGDQAEQVTRKMALKHFSCASEQNASPLFFDGSPVSLPVAVLVATQAADSMDAHDGYA